MSAKRPIILTFAQWYLPGHKAGGPVRSISNLIEILGEEFDFRVVTRDRDLGDTQPYTGIRLDTWIPVGKAQVRYLSPPRQSLANVWRLLRETPHDLLYLNSFWSRRFSMIPLWLNRWWPGQHRPVLLAPRGEFSRGALGLKSRRKRLYLNAARILRIYQDIVWQASSQFEADDISRQFLRDSHIYVANPITRILLQILAQERQAKLARDNKVRLAPDLPSQLLRRIERASATRVKPPGDLKLVFLSRLNPMKNLEGALRMLRGLQGHIELHVFGPVEDVAYEAACRRVAASLPANVAVEFHGAVPYDQVYEVLARHDALLLPTHGENFGHVILEALIAGCPPVISDRTPWRDLATPAVGWDLPLEQPDRFRAVLQQLTDMDQDELATMARRAQEYALAHCQAKEAVEKNRQLLREALNLSHHEAKRDG